GADDTDRGPHTANPARTARPVAVRRVERHGRCRPGWVQPARPADTPTTSLAWHARRYSTRWPTGHSPMGHTALGAAATAAAGHARSTATAVGTAATRLGSAAMGSAAVGYGHLGYPVGQCRTAAHTWWWRAVAGVRQLRHRTAQASARRLIHRTIDHRGGGDRASSRHDHGLHAVHRAGHRTASGTAPQHATTTTTATATTCD